MVSTSTSKPTTCYEVRSISLPPRSHPATLPVHEQLNNLKSRETCNSSSSSICFALAGVGELYRRVDDLLNLPMTRQALSHHRHEKWAAELLDGSMRLLDICGSIRDTVSSVKENLREVQSSLRRRKSGDTNAYNSFMRRIKKEAERSLKHMDKKTESPVSCLDLDHHMAGVVRVVREAEGVTGDVFGSLLSFLSVAGQARQRSSRWCVVAARMVHRGVVRCDESLNELEAVDRALSNIKTGEGVNKKLEAMDVAIQGIEDGLECLFRRLIHTRVSFLNILSH